MFKLSPNRGVSDLNIEYVGSTLIHTAANLGFLSLS